MKFCPLGEGLPATKKHGLSDAGIKAVDNQIKLICTVFILWLC